MSQKTHRLEFRIRLETGADERAPGGAVTVSLCGHWDHHGPCRWPHYSNIYSEVDGSHRLIVEFQAAESEVGIVSAKITSALHDGRLIGPWIKRSFKALILHVQ